MTASTDNNNHPTPGEELYLVHLRRIREEDDHDYLPRKRRASSIGEELWEVHRRRSQGMEDDLDRDTDDAHLSDKIDEPTFEKRVARAPSKKTDAPKCRYSLRSRDSQNKKA
mmetsp:Transcript_14036/g.35317  ORF Transcript_14036/g.35317 Transcript_14036/m.35317 type:complete len:112 (+) Transcript_14036:138-473(+)